MQPSECCACAKTFCRVVAQTSSDKRIDALRGAHCERQGIADKIIVLVGSEFGRTPYYNVDLGKDHWPVTSMMMMGPGITGGRVIGGTDDEFLPKTVDPTTLAEDPAGVNITPGNINAALRELAGIVDDPLVQPWALDAALPLLS